MTGDSTNTSLRVHWHPRHMNGITKVVLFFLNSIIDGIIHLNFSNGEENWKSHLNYLPSIL